MSAKILVIDDSLFIRQQVGNALTGAGFAVVEAADGADGLQKLTDHPHTRLIVCDLHMPRMNGFEFLQRLSADGSTLPVIILTTDTQLELIQHAKSLGAKHWIVKPFKPELLIAMAKRLLTAAA